MSIEVLIFFAILIGGSVISGLLLFWGERQERTLPSAGGTKTTKRRSF
jgi:hypothetical protein